MLSEAVTAYRAAVSAIENVPGDPTDAAVQAEAEAALALAQTPAHSLAGLALKAQIAEEMYAIHQTPEGIALVASILNDIKHLARH